MVVERERDLALSAQARQTIADIDAALARIAEGTYGYSVDLRPADPEGAPEGDPVGHRAGRGEGRRDRHAAGEPAPGRPRSAPHRGCAWVIAAVVVLRRPADQAVGRQRARRRPRGPRRRLAALQPDVQQRHGVQPGPRPGPVHRRRRPGRDRRPARLAAARRLDARGRWPSASSSAGRIGNVARPPVPRRRRLPRRLGGRLHRPAVVAGLQRRRHGDHGRRRAARRSVRSGAGRSHRSAAASGPLRGDPGGAGRRAGGPGGRLLAGSAAARPRRS